MLLVLVLTKQDRLFSRVLPIANLCTRSLTAAIIIEFNFIGLYDLDYLSKYPRNESDFDRYSIADSDN